MKYYTKIMDTDTFLCYLYAFLKDNFSVVTNANLIRQTMLLINISKCLIRAQQRIVILCKLFDQLVVLV